jgi:hypothetical protein
LLTTLSRLAHYIDGEEERKRRAVEERKEKLEKLERQIAAIDGNNFDDEGGAGKKRRLEDTEYVEQSKELVEGVKSAVTAGKSVPYVPCENLSVSSGLLKKKKKPKLDKSIAEKVVESSATAPLAAATAVAIASASA